PLHFVAVRAVDWKSGKPFAQVRLQLNTKLREPIQFEAGRFDSVEAYAWTDHYGVARFWMPEGEYTAMYQTTVAFEGIDSKKQTLDASPLTDFAPKPTGMSGGWVDGARRRAYVLRSNYFREDPPVQVRAPKGGKVTIRDVRVVGSKKMVP
ncbi:MAG: hypothetical protein AAGG44_17190, partial [Planctomycetota bacterium]